MSDSLWPHRLQHARLPSPSPAPRICSDSCPLSQWHHPSRPLSPPSLPAVKLFQHQGLFQRVGSLHQVAKYWSFSLSISPSNGYSVLIFFIIDWFDTLAVQGTLKSFLQHHSSKASILRHSAFFYWQNVVHWRREWQTISALLPWEPHE